MYIDIETRSRTSLKDLGVYRYTEDPDFAILMASWSLDGEHVETALGHDEILEIPGLFTEQKCAHNAQFERVCLATLDPRLRNPAQYVDTMALAAEYGHPVSLEAAARSLGAQPKDSAGAALIRLFCVPRRDGGWNDATTHPMEWLDFIAYCEQDVLTLADVHRRLGNFPTEVERRLWIADQLINDRGLRIDTQLCKVAAEAVIKSKGQLKQDFTRLTGVDNANSVPQVMRWVNEVGLGLPNLRAETITEALRNPSLDPDHREALEMRQDLALAAGGKYTAALAAASPDGRIRGAFRFFGAHTGRWSGQGVQPQNLPRATIPNPEARIVDLHLGDELTPYELKALVRSMFVGPLTVVDFASIEARVLAWLAREEWALQAFKDHRDIYVETANRMTAALGGKKQFSRFEGKVAVLALGYNGGINSLRNMGAEGTDDELQNIVGTWRKTNARIVKFWADMQEAIDDGGKVGRYIRVVRTGDNMRIELPSGRAIHYHGMTWEKFRQKVYKASTGKRVSEDVVNSQGQILVKEAWRYRDRWGNRVGTYGGRLTENVTQAIARDLLAEAIIRLEDAGYQTVGHVHDEVIVETTDVEAVREIMVQVPEWALGLPIEAEGFTTERYRKG